jgi:two-component system, NtrC family, response regulator PilR
VKIHDADAALPSRATGRQDPDAALPYFLFVDDNAEITRGIRHVSVGCGLEVCTTTSAVSFRESYLRRVPDLVGFDLAIPDGDGIELIRFLAAHHCRAPIMLISGQDRRVRAAAVRLGKARGLDIAEELGKPFRMVVLRAALDRLRERALLHRDART